AAPAPAGPVVPARAAAAWVASTSAATGIGPVAMRAYANATLALAAEQPACRVGWTTLASIGATESGHGTHGGAVLDDDGRPSLPIIGPALDGRPGFAAIPADPDATAWHGDPVWDHAVGPLQFLPSTWRRWGADGDGDQVADPNDLDDAALAAGRYLCAAGTDLTAAPAWQAAVLSYNHSHEYVAAILASANGYAAASQASGGGA
ncbi:lytic murein transglycosylase, partial [Pengzhenrongella frigida]